MDAVSTLQTLTDPCTTLREKALSISLFLLGVVAPGGGYSTGERATTHFLANVEVRSFGKVIGTGTVDLRPTLNRIKTGEKLPYRGDGTIFKNREGLLPNKPEGYYSEYVHPTPGVNNAGPQRIIVGQGGELYYTPDHYGTFIPLK